MYRPTSTKSAPKSNAKQEERKIKVITKSDGQMAVRSCGVVLFRKVSIESHSHYEFLLMKTKALSDLPAPCSLLNIEAFSLQHPNRYDLSKGHQEEGETDTQTALRETWEETGIAAQFISLAPGFSFTEVYHPTYKRFGGKRVEKTICIFAGLASEEGVSKLKLSEHGGCEWKRWQSPNPAIQKNTIDPLVKHLEAWFADHPIDAAATWGKSS